MFTDPLSAPESPAAHAPFQDLFSCGQRPLIQLPEKPNFHAPSGSPSLTADPANQSPSIASRVNADLGYDLAEGYNDWLVKKPAANDASRGLPCPPMQRAGEATQGSGSK